MAEIVKGADVAAKLKENITERLAKLRSSGRDAKLTILSVGDDPANASYERGIIKVFTALDIPHEKVVLEAGCSQEEFDSAFTKINEDPTVTGILISTAWAITIRLLPQWAVRIVFIPVRLKRF